MKRLLVIEIETDREETWTCGSCKYGRTGDFCELFRQSSQETSPGMMDRVNDCFTAERRFLDLQWREHDLSTYEHPRNRLNKK